MTREWQMLYDAAAAALKPRQVSPSMDVGSVAAAVLSGEGHVYTGVCIDTQCSLGMCAERNALSTMLACGEDRAARVVAVYQDGRVIPPCGACRAFMLQLGGDAGSTEILLDNSGRTATLRQLMPEFP